MKKSNEKVLVQNIEEKEVLDYNKDNREFKEGEDYVFRGYTNGNDDWRNRVFGVREYGRDSGLDEGEDTGEIGRRNGIHEGISDTDLRNDEIGLLSRESKSESLQYVSGSILQGSTNSSFDGNSGESYKLYENGRTKNDESMESNRRDGERKSTRIQTINEQSSVSIERDCNKGSSGSLKENNIINEEAGEASFFYSKDDPDNLMTDEMLKRVPKLYEQEDSPLSEKEVHAVYFIPFKSNWTWYMTEFDRETGNAFGLVLGVEPEWGYFNINELKELKAQRLVLEDFPKTFRELKDTELVNQMTSEELAFVFNNELKFEKDKDYDLYDNLEEENIVDIDLFEEKAEEERKKESSILTWRIYSK